MRNSSLAAYSGTGRIIGTNLGACRNKSGKHVIGNTLRVLQRERDPLFAKNPTFSDSGFSDVSRQNDLAYMLTCLHSLMRLERSLKWEGAVDHWFESAVEQ